MTDVTLRATKGSPLTHTEMDNNQVATRSGRKNMVIGGNFSTNPWQRGTAFTAQGSGDYGADRFRHTNLNAGTAVIDHDRVADAPSVAQAGFLTSYCLSVDVTTADVTLAANAHYDTMTIMEGYDYAQIAQNDFVLSFWHKHTKTGTYCVAFLNDAGDRSYVAEYTQSVTDTWEKATIKVTASPSAGTWNYTSGQGILVGFSMGTGTDYHATADSWQTGQFRSTVNQVNAMDSASNFCRFALIQIEEGIEATDFERRYIGEELALCERYYWDGALADHGTYIYGLAGHSIMHAGATNFPVKMRATPTMAVKTAGTRVNCTGEAPTTGVKNTSFYVYTTVTANGKFRITSGVYSADAEL